MFDLDDIGMKGPREGRSGKKFQPIIPRCGDKASDGFQEYESAAQPTEGFSERHMSIIHNEGNSIWPTVPVGSVQRYCGRNEELQPGLPYEPVPCLAILDFIRIPSCSTLRDSLSIVHELACGTLDDSIPIVAYALHRLDVGDGGHRVPSSNKKARYRGKYLVERLVGEGQVSCGRKS